MITLNETNPQYESEVGAISPVERVINPVDILLFLRRKLTNDAIIPTHNPNSYLSSIYKGDYKTLVDFFDSSVDAVTFPHPLDFEMLVKLAGGEKWIQTIPEHMGIDARDLGMLIEIIKAECGIHARRRTD